MANGDNPLPQMQLDANGLPIGTSAPQQPTSAATPPAPTPSQATPPDPASNTASSIMPTGFGQSPFGPGGETLPAPYQGPALRGGPVKNILTRMFYGMGQAAAAHVGLPTDYDIQRTQFNQAIQANDLALKQAQIAQQYQMVTLPNGVTLPLQAAMKVYPALIGAQSREDVARLNKELIPTAQGLYRTGYATGQAAGFVPGTERGTYVDDELVSQYPWMAPVKGSFLKTPELMRLYSQGLQTVPTTTTTYDPVLQTTTVTHKYKNIPGNLPGAAAPAAAASSATAPAAPTSGALPEIPQPVQSPLLGPDGKPLPSQADVDRWAQSGIQYHGPVAPSGPAAPIVPPAVTNVLPPGSPAARAFAGAPAGPQGATTTPTAPTVAGPAAGAIPPPPPGVPMSIWQAGVKLATGYGNPNVASRSKYGTAILDAADTYSRQTTGKPYDQAGDVINFNYANQTTTQNTLKFLNSLTGSDNKSGNLQTLIKMSDSPALARFQWPAANDVQAWMRLQSGSGPQAAYAALALETADQVGKILAGGQQGTSDKKLNDAQALFQKGFNTEQMRDTATALRTALANRKNEMIANNPYLQRQYGQPSATQAPGANWGAQFGAKPK